MTIPRLGRPHRPTPPEPPLPNRDLSARGVWDKEGLEGDGAGGRGCGLGVVGEVVQGSDVGELEG